MLLGNVLRWETDYLGRQHPVLPGGARVRAQGEAARPAGRAGDGGVLRAARHRLPGRGVPDGRGQPAPRLQGGAQRRSRTRSPGHEGRVPVRLPRARRTTASPATPSRSATRCAPCAECGAPDHRASVCAFCRLRERAAPATSAGRARPTVATCRAFAPGDRVLLVDAKRRRHLVTLAEGGAFHSHAGVLEHDALIGQPTRASTVRTTLGRAARRGAADARRVRAQDAARRAGHLPEGPRPDPHARRHLPGRARARVGRRLGRAHDDAAAGGRARRATCIGYELRDDFARPRPPQRRGLPRPRRPARRSRCATSTTASTIDRPRPRRCSTSPSRGGS